MHILHFCDLVCILYVKEILENKVALLLYYVRLFVSALVEFSLYFFFCLHGSLISIELEQLTNTVLESWKKGENNTIMETILIASMQLRFRLFISCEGQSMFAYKVLSLSNLMKRWVTGVTHQISEWETPFDCTCDPILCT